MVETLLVISPHPDDLEIGMGGTVAKEIAKGNKIISVVLTDGRRSQRSFLCDDDKMAEIRLNEVKASTQLLGISDLYCLNLLDIQSLENQTKLLEELAKLLFLYQPSKIYITHPNLDKHPTHSLAGNLVLKLINELIKDEKLNNTSLWAYEVWGLFSSWDLAVDITDFVEQKKEAINCHKSQVTDIAYDEGILGLNRWRAVFSDPHQISNGKYVEVFIKL